MKLLSISALVTCVLPGFSRAHDAKLVSAILQAAKPFSHRGLESDDVPDISGYYLHFRRCAVRTQMAVSDDDSFAVETKKFAVFRLCSSCHQCAQSEHAEYVVDLETYASEMSESYKRSTEWACEDCYDSCLNDDANGGRRLDGGDDYCTECVETCQAIDNMEDNGYLDVSDYLECKELEQEDNDDDANIQYYAGPKCSSSGKKINLAVYTDQYCTVEAEDLTIESFLGYDDNGNQYQMDYTNLNKVNQRECISCLGDDRDGEQNGDDGDDAEEQVQISEICEKLYKESGRCESPYGFYAEYMNDDDQVKNSQYGQEDSICEFIDEITAAADEGTYSAPVRKASFMQKMWLTIFILGTIGFAGCAYMLNSKANTEKVDLNYQGGAMS